MRVIPMSCDLIRVIIDDLAVVCMMKLVRELVSCFLHL